jgi:3-mercaptopyruvate sulfurtransferase SseA
MSIKRVLPWVATILVLSISACNLQSRGAAPTVVPTQIPQPAPTGSAANLPRTEAEVPRVPVEAAKTALDRGEAVIVDVRSSDAYAASHIAEAINIPLVEIEANPSRLNLDKDRWIITYCT